jgi:hypothetical protein
MHSKTRAIYTCPMPSIFASKNTPPVFALASLLLGCGPAPIHVNGVIREAPEMRPLRNLPLGAYRELAVFVRAVSEAMPQGATDCSFTPLEGSADKNNTACVPVDAANDAVRLVRQRMRSYGVNVVREAKEPYDYDVQVLVIGVAPKKADPSLTRARARLTFTLQANSAANGIFAGIDQRAAAVGFGSVVRDCALQDADFTQFSASAFQPMTPEFDLAVLASDAVDNLIGCDQLARFFLEVRTRYPGPRPGAQPGAPAPLP